MMRQISCAISGARPSVASSRISSRGLVMQRAADRQHLLLAAGELLAAVAAAARRGAGTSRARARRSSRAARRVPGRAAITRFSTHRSGWGRCRGPRARRRCRAARSSSGGARSCRAPQAIRTAPRAATRPISVRISVVLPMPLRPIRPTVSPRADRKIDAVQDVARAVVGVQAARLDEQRASCGVVRRRDRRCCTAGSRRGPRPAAPLAITLAVDHHGDPVGDREHRVHVVLDEQHRVRRPCSVREQRRPCARLSAGPCRRAARRAAAPSARSPAPSRSRAGAARRG